MIGYYSFELHFYNIIEIVRVKTIRSKQLESNHKYKSPTLTTSITIITL